jgi:filamentous hemagglutinin family protein
MNSGRNFARSAASLLTLICVATPFLALAAPASTTSLPTDGRVVGGSATIDQVSKTQLDINQSTTGAIVDWKTFNIGSKDTVTFNQPTNGVTLNRVVNSASPSQIFGTLNANGTIMLVNSQGVVFGKGSEVNVGGLVATSSDIDNRDFMKGKYKFDRAGNTQAQIINEGNITVKEGGLAAFVAPSVVNEGVIEARMGKVQLASGETFSVDLYGDGLVNLQASDKLKKELVQNSGLIEANGGQVLMTTAAARDAVNSLINMNGIIEADTVGTKNGQVVLSAQGQNSTVEVSGKINADGKLRDQTGGSVDLAATNIDIAKGADISASGEAGGGSVVVQGVQAPSKAKSAKGAVPTHITVAQGAVIEANATRSGNGGSVTLAADSVDFAGTINAKGEGKNGNGGFVDMSAPDDLYVTGTVDAGAERGTAGTWSMESDSLTIASTMKTPMSTFGPTLAFAPVYFGSTVDANSISNALSNGTNVTVTAQNTGSLPGNIAVDTAILASGERAVTLSLNAANSVDLASNVSIASRRGALNVFLQSGSEGGSTTFERNASLRTNGGNVTVTGGAVVMNWGSSIVTRGGNVTFGGESAAQGNARNSDGIALYDATVDAQGGDISFAGTGYNSGWFSSGNGVLIADGSVVKTAEEGSISIVGSASGFGFGNGVEIVGRDTRVSANDGDINITGSVGSAKIIPEVPVGSAMPLLMPMFIVGNGVGIDIADGAEIGGRHDRGNINFVTDTLRMTEDAVVRAKGLVSFDTYNSSTSIGVAGARGTLQLNDTVLRDIDAGTIQIGDTTHSGAFVVDAYRWNSNAVFLNGAADIEIAGKQRMGDHTFLADSANGNIVIDENGGVSSSADGNAIVLAATNGNFINRNSSADTLMASDEDGRWLIYSTSPLSDTMGGLSSDFHRYSCEYNGTCPSFPAQSNGNLYRMTPFLTVTPDAASTVYGDAAPTFTYSLSGFLLPGDNLGNVTGTPSLTSAYAVGSNAGSYDIGAAAASLASALGYSFTYTTLTNGLTVNKAVLTVNANDQSRGLGAPNPAFTYTYSGLKNGDTSGVFSGALATNAMWDSLPGLYDILQGGLNAGGNYTIAYTPGTLAVGSPVSQLNSLLRREAVKMGGKKPGGTLLAILNPAPAVGGLAGLSPAAGGGAPVDLANLSPSAGGRSNKGDVTSLIECSDATPCAINQ